MAIGPNKQNEKLLLEAAKVEKVIDRTLAAIEVGPEGINLSVAISQEVFDILKPRYIASGWHSLSFRKGDRLTNIVTFRNK